jgi:hypothetical protein
MPNIPRLLAERQLAERQRQRRRQVARARPTLRFVPESIDQVPGTAELDADSRVQVVHQRPTLQGMPPVNLPPEPLSLEDDEPTNEDVGLTERTREEVPSMFRAPPSFSDLEVTRERVPRMFRAPPSPRDREVTAKHDMSLLRMLISG